MALIESLEAPQEIIWLSQGKISSNHIIRDYCMFNLFLKTSSDRHYSLSSLGNLVLCFTNPPL